MDLLPKQWISCEPSWPPGRSQIRSADRDFSDQVCDRSRSRSDPIAKLADTKWRTVKHFEAFCEISWCATSNCPSCKLITFLLETSYFAGFWKLFENLDSHLTIRGSGPPGNPFLTSTRTLRSKLLLGNKNATFWLCARSPSWLIVSSSPLSTNRQNPGCSDRSIWVGGLRRSIKRSILGIH